MILVITGIIFLLMILAAQVDEELRRNAYGSFYSMYRSNNYVNFFGY